MRVYQRGISGAFVAVILVLVAAVALAAMVLSRANLSVARGGDVSVRFQRIQEALTQYVAANKRLPCPANPAADDGAEVVGVGGTCANPEGTVPWLTIGARRGDGIDPWSGKISYRVYTGTAGSLTQAGGASMIQCDSVESTPTMPTAVSGSEGGLCRANSRVTLLDTSTINFLAGKGLSVDDLGTNRTDVAYVLISHGPTGLGAYTTAGIRQALPASGGDERANTTATGPFVIKAFSASGTDSTVIDHFDDYLAYRRLEDLIRAAGVHARDWPEEAASTTTFNRASVEAAVGTSVTPGSGVGQVSVNFAGVVASGLSGGIATEVSFDQAVDASWAGIGMAGGGSALLQSSANELLRFEVERASKFAVTLTNFGYYSGTFLEIVEFRFFNNGADLGVERFGVACNIDGEGTLASFSMDVGAAFDRVDITPYPAFDTATSTLSGITATLVSEIKTCPADAATCVTSLSTVGNTCTVF